MPNIEDPSQFYGQQTKSQNEKSAQKSIVNKARRKASPKDFSSIVNGYKARRTLLFDLDETLIHCVENINEPGSYQHLIDIKLDVSKPAKSRQPFNYGNQQKEVKVEDDGVV